MNSNHQMKRINWSVKIGLLLLIHLVLSCHQTKDTNDKVIVVHARGITYPDMVDHLNSIKSDDFFKRKEASGSIKKLHPITNAVTICNMASYETGSMPSEHGIIGHLFGLKEDDSVRVVSGFAQRFATETFWEKADIQGKKVLNLGALTIHGKYEHHTNVDCLAQGSQIGSPQILHVIPDKEHQSHSITKYKNLEGKDKLQLQQYPDALLVYQINQADKNNELILDDDYNHSNGFFAKIKSGTWSEIEHAKDRNIKRAFRVKWIPSSKDTLSLYIRASYANRGYPDEFVEQIDSGIGPSRGWPNIPFYTSKNISATTLTEEMNAEVDYVMDAFSFAVQKKDYDLIMIDYPLIDRLGHAFLGLRDSSIAVQKHYKAAFNRMNKDFERIEEFARRNGYDLIITSGHGFSPIHTSIDINTFLNKNGIHTNHKETGWEAIGVPGKVSAHIYVNDQLNPKDKAAVLSKIENVFKTLYGPAKTPVVDNIYRKNKLKDINLFHRNAGDLYILLNPGFVFENNRDEGDRIFGTPTFMGDHGYSLKHEDSFGILVSNTPCEPCHSTDVSKIIEEQLKLD